MERKYRVGILIFLLIFSLSSAKFHPGIRWKELRNNKFIIIYPDGYENSADKVFGSADKIYSELHKYWGWKIRGKIRIVLKDDSDLPGSKSTFFPYNQIELSLFPPDNFSIIGRWENLLEELLKFELNSLFILNCGSNSIYALRKYLGFNTLFFPTGFIPGWVFSGIAANSCNEQDVNTIFNREYIKIIIRQYIKKHGKFPNIGSLRSNLHQWPVNLSKLHFGIYFINYIKKIFGTNKLKEFISLYTKHPLPIFLRGSLLPVMLSMTKRFKMVFGKKPVKFASHIVNRINKINPQNKLSVKRITNSGFQKRYPLKISKAGIVYFEENFKSPPKIRLMDRNSKKNRILAAKYDVTGIGFEKEKNSLLFTARDFYKIYYYYSDLYRIELKTGEISRLTYGERLSSPVSNGRSIFCIKREKDKSVIAKLSPDGKKIVVVSPGFEFISDLSVSPHGERLSFCAKKRGLKRFIALLNNKTGEIYKIDENIASDYSPEFISETEMIYLSNESRKTILKRYNLLSGEMGIYRDFQASLLADPFVDKDGDLIAPILFGDGYDLGIIDPGTPEKKCILSLSKINAGNRYQRKLSVKPFRYDPFRDFLPRYFTLSFRSGGNEIQSGLVMSGFDSLKKHYFKFKIMRGFLSNSWNSYFNYLFDESFGTFGIKYTNFTDWNITQLSEQYRGKYKKLRFYFNLPLFRLSHGSLELYSDLHFESESESGFNNGLIRKKKYNGFRAGISFDSTVQLYDSLWRSDGMMFNLSYSRELSRFGSSGNIYTYSLEYRQFIRITGKDVLGLRFVLADSGGDENMRFYMGGVNGSKDVKFAGENHFNLMRGYPSGYFSGSGGYLANMEYRFQLLRVERPFIIFKSIERIYFSIFADVGRLWDFGELKPLAFSTGGEFNIVLYLGKYRYILTAGIGRGMNPKVDPRFYFRIGSSF